MKQSKLLAILICLSLMLAVLAGCADNQTHGNTSSADESSQVDDASSTPDESSSPDESSEPDESSMPDESSQQDESSMPDESGEAHTHAFGEWTTVEESTCSKQGYRQRTCSECGKTETETLELAAHTEVVDKGYDATCSAAGLTDGKHCSVCGAITVAQQTVAAKPHTEVIDKGTAATCTEAGKTDGSHCSVCGTVIKVQQDIPASGHAYDDDEDEICNNCGYKRDITCKHKNTQKIPGKSATCTETGLTDGKKCSKCGEILVAQTVIPAKGHTPVTDKAVEPTCTETGLTEGSHCKVCNTVITAQSVIPAKGHTPVTDKAVEPTCTETGLTEGSHCSICNTVLVKQTTVSALGHDESDWIIDKAATTTEEGKRHTECTRCHIKISEETIAATGSVGLAYTVNDDKKSCTITDIGTCTDSHVVIPSVIDGYAVTAIGNRAFYNCMTFTEITIPESVKTIGTQIFYKASNLNTVYYNSSYSSIDNLFFRESNVKKVIFGNANVPAHILRQSYVTDVILTDNVRYIYESPFLYSSIVNITITENLKGASYNAFAHGNTHDFYNIYYQGSLESWINRTWSDSPIASYNLYIQGNLISDLVIPEILTEVGSNAFDNCISIKSVTFHKNITYVGPAFFSCRNLTDVFFSDENGKCRIGIHAFWSCSSLINISLGNSVTSIGDYAFSGCTSLESIVIPDSVKFLGKSFIVGCSSLNSITIGAGIDDINSKLFGLKTNDTYLSSLRDLTINGSGKTTIDRATFQFCDTLKNVTLCGVSYIGEEAFVGCDSLTTVQLGDGLKSIGVKAFCDCDELKRVVIPDTATSLGEKSFYDCDSLTELVIGNSVTAIGKSAFASCGKMQNVTIGNSVTSIGDYAFESCESLKSVIVPDSVTKIGTGAFRWCYSLESVTIGSNVSDIPQEAFAFCRLLTEINYTGTIKEWGKVSKDVTSFIDIKAIVVHCKDGDCSINN